MNIFHPALKGMFKFIAITAVVLSVSETAIGQDRIPVDLRPFQVTIGILEPSVILEARIGEHQSFAATGGLTLGFGDDEVYVFPFARGAFRNYYPRKRVKKSNLRQNSGNYIALQGGYYFPALSEFTTSADKSYFVGPAWGIQRNYGSGIHLGLSLGIGYGNGKYQNGHVAGVGHFTFGFTLK